MLNDNNEIITPGDGENNAPANSNPNGNSGKFINLLNIIIYFNINIFIDGEMVESNY